MFYKHAFLVTIIYRLQEGDSLEELSKIHESSACLFLALLGNSTGDLALCHNSTVVLSIDSYCLQVARRGQPKRIVQNP